MNIIIVDDDDIVVMSLKTIIESKGINVVGTGKSGEDAVALYMEHKPDVVLSDIRMNGLDGISAACEILSKDKDAKILLLTTFSDDEYVTGALKNGIKGYILKQDFDGIVPALNAVYSGQSVFGGEIINKIPTIVSDSKKSDRNDFFETKGISEKEMEIIECVADGLNNKEISEKLCLSEGTVRNYLSNILEKLELRDRTQLVVAYYKDKGAK